MHSESRSTGSVIREQSANVITREYRKTPVDSVIVNCPWADLYQAS